MQDNLSNTIQIPGLPRRETIVLRWILMLTAILFAVGIATPMITVSKFVVISNSFSVLSGIIELLQSGQIILFVVVAGFSLVLPVLKFYVLFRLLSTTHSNGSIKRYLHLMHDYGRWAMLDVMVVAVLVVTVKLGAIASIEIHYGLFIFGAAVLMIMLVTHRIVRLTSVQADS